MKTTLGVLLLTVSVSVHAQQSTSRTVPVTPFRAEVQNILSKYPNGEKLYARCDLFSRLVNMKAARNVGIHSQLSSHERISPMSEASSSEQDIANNIDDDDEPSIAINHKNPNLIVAGANDILFKSNTLAAGGMLTFSMPSYVSTDAGTNWKTYRLPKVNDGGSVAFGDPMIISDDAGTFYYAFLVDADPTGFGAGPSDLMVARSSDGIHWSLGQPVVGNSDNGGSLYTLEDKETIAIDRDRHSPHFGRLYIAWTEYQSDYSQPTPYDTIFHYVSSSDDKGNSWSAPTVFTTTYGYFATIRVGTGGVVFISSMEYNGNGNNVSDTGTGSHGLSASTDGGQTFTDQPIANFNDFLFSTGTYRAGLKGEYGFRATPYSTFDVDGTNKIYAVYGTRDVQNDEAQLFEITSQDLGNSWSAPVEIGTPEGLDDDHYMPWVTVDPITQEAFISLSSSEEDPIENVLSREVRCNFTSPNQLDFLGSRLFNTLVDTVSGVDFLGDYSQCEAYDGYFAAAWTENRPSNFDNGNIFAYVSAPDSPIPTGGVTTPINEEQLSVHVTPNPVTSATLSLSISSNDQLPAQIHIYDLRGVEVIESETQMDPAVPSSVSLDIHALPAGVYRAIVTSGRMSAEQNFVVLR